MDMVNPGGLPTANIHPLKFEKRFDYNEDGSVKKESVWVTWAKKGVGIPTETSDKVTRVQKDPEIWRALKPHYEAWLEGNSFVTDGTPLEVWPGLEGHQIELVRKHKCFSVEDFANMNDGDVAKLGFPGARDRRDAAREFVKNRSVLDQTKVLEAKIAQLEAKLKDDGEGEPKKRGPGRPRKEEAA